MQTFKIKFSFFILGISLLFLGACSNNPPKKEPTPQEMVQEQHRKLLDNTWSNFDTTEEKIIQTCRQMEARGGAEISQLRYDQIRVSKLMKQKVLKQDERTGKYVLTDFGKEVYTAGQALAAASIMEATKEKK